MNRSDAVHDLIARAPSLVRQARLGDQNALAIIMEVGDLSRKGDPTFKMIYRAFDDYIRVGQPASFGGRGRPAPKHAAPKRAGVTRAQHGISKASHAIVAHKAGTSVLAPKGKVAKHPPKALPHKAGGKHPNPNYQGQGQGQGQGGGGGDSGGSDGGGGFDGGGYGAGDSSAFDSSAADNGGFDASADSGIDDSGDSALSPIDETAESAINGEAKALGVVEQIFQDAYNGNARAQILARGIQDYIRRSRLKGQGAVATVVGLANGRPLSRARIGEIAAEFSGEAKSAFYAGVEHPHANVPPLSPEMAKCIRLGQCVGIARNLQASRMQRTRLSQLHPIIGWEAGEEYPFPI